MDNLPADNDLTREEAAALEDLGRSRTVFPGHEDRTVSALYATGGLRKGFGLSRLRGAWGRRLRLVGVGAALVAAFFLGTAYQKTQDPPVQEVFIPVGVDEDAGSHAVAYHFELDDPFEESFSNADAHPKERLSKSLRNRDR